MKRLLPLLILVQTPVFAAVYRFPVEKIPDPVPPAELQKLELLSTFPMPEFKVDTNHNDRIRYGLPVVLTGRKIVMEMDKVSDEDGVRSYQANDGSGKGECTGPVQKPTCQIEVEGLHLDDPANVKLRNQKIAATYTNPADQARVQLMADLFSEQLPIGIVNGKEIPTVLSLQGRWWHGSYTVNGKAINTDVCFFQGSDQFLGQYRVGMPFKADVPCGKCPTTANGAFCGTLDNIALSSSQLSGRWRTGNSSGFIKFVFDESLNFTGNYGGNQGSSVQGSWSGRQ